MWAGEGGMDRENRTEIRILPYVKQLVGKVGKYGELNPALCDNLEGWEGGSMWGDIYILMVDSCCCMGETNTTL